LDSKRRLRDSEQPRAADFGQTEQEPPAIEIRIGQSSGRPNSEESRSRRWQFLVSRNMPSTQQIR
jgi:hypothetical protein